MRVCVLGVWVGGMKPSRDSPVLMIPSLVHLGQPGPDVRQVGRTRASVREREREKKQLGEEKVRELSLALQLTHLSVVEDNTQLSFGGRENKAQ